LFDWAVAAKSQRPQRKELQVVLHQHLIAPGRARWVLEGNLAKRR
jgi:hypothetical protein